MKLKKILVTTDFSELSRQAFVPAASLARRFKAELHLVHVMEPLSPVLYFTPTGAQAYSPESDYRLKFKELLQKTAEDPALAGLPVKTHLLEGADVLEIVKKFQKSQAIDLTVTSTHGRTGLGHLFLGSFAEKVVRYSHCPVLVFRPQAPGEAKEFAPRRLLVPYDLSENARAVLDSVRLLAQTFKPLLRFLYVVEPLPDLAILGMEGMALDETALQSSEARERARRELSELVRRELPDLPQVETVADHGVPFVEIIRQAREFQADLIVMATHGRTGIRHMFMGSVAEKVVRKAPCSVLTVRPAALEFERP